MDHFTCPCCYENYHSNHCDGLHKLYRWDRQHEVWRDVYYGEEFFVPKVCDGAAAGACGAVMLPVVVQVEMQAVEALINTAQAKLSEINIKCGVAEWNAARDQVSSGISVSSRDAFKLSAAPCCSCLIGRDRGSPVHLPTRDVEMCGCIPVCIVCYSSLLLVKVWLQEDRGEICSHISPPHQGEFSE